MTNKQEITTALHLWFQPGDVFEVRVLDAVTLGYSRPHVEFGYFDYDHIDLVAEELDTIRAYKGVYVTVNPVNPDLLARSCNRLRVARRDSTTADTDVLRRRWLLVDCDAKRPSGISSTNEEHAYALAKAAEIRDGLASIGWPAPVETDSGNGAQLMYRIDLATKDDGLVQKVIAEIAKVSDEHTAIDLTVYNPARIWRLPGTTNAKGDSTESRPHRMAKLLNVPAEMQPVSEDLLRSIVKTISPAQVAPAPVKSFDIDAWIRQYCPGLGEPSPWQGGRKWVFPVCPFNPEHNDRSAVLIEQPSGAIAFRCHHNGCAGHDWHKLREMKEPAAYVPKEPLPEVNMTPFLEKVSNTRPVISRETIEKEVLEGTVLGRVCKLLGSVTDPPLPLEVTLPKALVLIGAALSEKKDVADDGLGKGPDLARLTINTGGGQVCNFYCVLAAPSASGKDIGGLLERCALGKNWYVGSSGSAEGLADAYCKRGNGILCISEMQPWLDERRWQHNATEFLVFAFNKGFFSQCFSKRGGNSEERASTYCFPNIMANVQPDVFRTIVKKTDVDNGFLGRFIFTKMPEFDCEPASFDSRKVQSKILTCLDIFRRKEGVVDVPFGYAREIKTELKAHSESNVTSSINRLCNEYYPRLAVILSVTESVCTHDSEVVLTPEAWEKARKLVRWFHQNARSLLTGVDDAEPNIKAREELLRKVFRKVKLLDKGNGVTRRDISLSGVRNSTGSERTAALSELVDRGILYQEGIHYKIRSTPDGWE